MDEQPLSTWGSGTSSSRAVRAGGVVLTEGGAWSPPVLALLRHLEEAGFDGAPRVVGDGRAADGRLTLTHVPGESPHPHAWPDDTVHEVGVLLRRLHDATSTFVPPAGAVWQPTYLRAIGDGDTVLGHGDAAPWNIVGRDGGAGALIDWEYAGPVDRLTELAYAAWLNAQLHDDDVAERQGLPDAATRARQLHAVLDGYGLPAERRPALVDRMVDVAVHGACDEAMRAGVTHDSTEAVDTRGYPVLWAVTWRARSASWMLRHRRLLLG